VAIKLFCREEAQKDAKKEKPKNMLRVMICWLRAFVNFVLFFGCKTILPQRDASKREKRMLPNSFFFQTQQSFSSINFGTARSLHAAALERIKNAFCYFFRCGVFYHDFLIKIGLLPLLSK
jgi:hypothetical protein